MPPELAPEPALEPELLLSRLQSERFLKRYLEYARTAVAPAVSLRAGETLAAEYVSLREEVRPAVCAQHICWAAAETRAPLLARKLQPASLLWDLTPTLTGLSWGVHAHEQRCWCRQRWAAARLSVTAPPPQKP